METRTRNWGKGRSKAAAKRRKVREAKERFERQAGHTHEGRVIRPIPPRH
jgi:hypothetical protein